MKSYLTLSSLLVAALLTSGCGEGRAEKAHTHTHQPKPAATYKAGHGLQLTSIAASFIDLGTADVGTRDFAESKGATAIPATALVRTVKGDFVYVVNGEWFLRTPVKLSANDSSHFAVEEGLYEGDKIVTRGARELWLAELQAINGGVGCADGH
jgi:hypothetical protein